MYFKYIVLLGFLRDEKRLAMLGQFCKRDIDTGLSALPPYFSSHLELQGGKGVRRGWAAWSWAGGHGVDHQ